MRRHRDTLARIAGALLALVVAASGSARANETWFAPRGPEIGGSPDWDQLFRDTPAWNSVADQINVYYFTAGYVLRTPDAVLQAAIANLRSHHISLALGAQSLAVTPADKCGHVEGYSPIAETTAAADKLVRLGIRLDILALDSPVLFGHYSSGAEQCHFSVAEVVERSSATARVYLDRFPNLVVGDVEGLPSLVVQPDWRVAYESFLSGFAARLGRGLSFVQTDDDWSVPEIDGTITRFAAFAHAHGLKVGVFYDGGGDDRTDAAWVASAIAHFTRLESVGGFVPDQAVVATWNKRPTDVLPPTDPATFSHVLAVYGRSRVQLVAARRPNAVTGRLLDAQGKPVAGAALRVMAVGSSADRLPQMRIISGTVPARARSALLGMRVNMECNCDGANDLIVGDLVYAEAADKPPTEAFSVSGEAIKRRGGLWDGVHVWPVTTPQGLAARVVVPPGQHWGFNSPIFPVVPEAPFTLRMPIGAMDGGGLFGTAMVLWLDADHQGISRDNITLVRDTTDIAQGTTDDDGHFAIALPDAAAYAGRHLRVIAAATPATRGTITALPASEP